MCVIFIYERQLFYENIWGSFISRSEYLLEICGVEVAKEIFYHISILMFDLGFEPHDDFNQSIN